MAFDYLVACITLAGSALSAVATACVLLCFAVFQTNQTSFRHVLVFNLALSDFINSTNNSISGIIYMRDHVLLPTPACVANGFLGQISVQATDFSILAISLSTLLVVLQKARLGDLSTTGKIALCLSTWIVPLVTATVATAMGEMKPVSGSWCWISAGRTDLRYSLAHGWRFAIILITIATYTFIWCYVTRHFRNLSKLRYGGSGSHGMSEGVSSSASGGGGGGAAKQEQGERLGSLEGLVNQEVEVEGEQQNHSEFQSRHMSGNQEEYTSWASAPPPPPPPGTQHMNRQSRRAEKDVKRMLLLNGYPIMYVVLWIPGLTNRIMEASGADTPSRALAILQTSTQFVGFANSITYGLNQQWRADR